MKIKFLVDCIGRETAMVEYKAGDIADFPTAQALELIRIGHAEEFNVVEIFERKKKVKHDTDTQ